MNDSIPSPNDPIPEETENSEKSKEQRREILKMQFLAILGFCALTTLFFFLFSIPISFSSESWILQPQTRTVKRAMPRLAGKLDAYRKKHGVYPNNLEDVFETDETETWIEYETQDGWGNPLIYETDGNDWKLTSNGADGKPGGIGINADFFCTNHMFELGTMNNAALDARPTWGQVLLSDRLWVMSCIFAIGPAWICLLLSVGKYMLGLPVLGHKPNKTEFYLGIAGILLVSLLWAWFFSIALMIPTGH